MSLPSSVTARYLEFYGESGISLEDAGKLTTDRAHLATVTAVLRVRRDQWNGTAMNSGSAGGGNIGAPHPIFSFCTMENRELSIQGPWAYAVCKYAGIETQYSTGGTPPQYELIAGVSESPIATHPDFNKTSFAGTAKAPAHGANFRNLFTKHIARASSPADSIEGYVFDSFDVFNEGTPPTLNDFAGITSYLEGNLTWRKSWKMNRYPTNGDIDKIGHIATPPGSPPTGTVPDPDRRTWLNMGITCSRQRGSAYFWQQEWRLSGRRGWDVVIYA